MTIEPNKPIVIITTCPNQQSADHIIERMLSKQLAACIQQMPITSDYRWEGKQEKSQEIKLEIKTLQCLFDEACACIRNNHPYDCPEIIAIPVLKSNEAYADWLRQNVKAT